MSKEEGIIFTPNTGSVEMKPAPKPLTNEELFQMVGSPVYVVSDYDSPKEYGWKVISMIKIDRNGMLISFTDSSVESMKNISCYREEVDVPPEEMTDEECRELLKKIRKRWTYQE